MIPLAVANGLSISQDIIKEDFGILLLIGIVILVVYFTIKSWLDDGTFNESWHKGWRKYPDYMTDCDRFNACARYTHLIKVGGESDGT